MKTIKILPYALSIPFILSGCSAIDSIMGGGSNSDYDYHAHRSTQHQEPSSSHATSSSSHSSSTGEESAKKITNKSAAEVTVVEPGSSTLSTPKTAVVTPMVPSDAPTVPGSAPVAAPMVGQ